MNRFVTGNGKLTNMYYHRRIYCFLLNVPKVHLEKYANNESKVDGKFKIHLIITGESE